MFSAAAILLSASLGAIAAAAPATVGGDFNVTGPQLYPEKCVYDPKRTVLYCSELYESKIAVIDLKTNTIAKTFDFPGLSGDKDYHASGLLLQGADRLISSINTGAAFESSGGNITGTNFLLITDLETGKETARVDVTAVTKGAYGGPQDFALDTCGNIYEVFTYPGAIIKVTPSSQVIAWHLSNSTSPKDTGFTGIASNGNLLLTSNQQAGGMLVRFNASDPKGQPFKVPIANNQTLSGGLDGILLPAKHKGTILLVTSLQEGTTVLRSKDGKWNSAEKLGTVPNPHWDQNGFATGTFEREDRIYAVFEWFLDSREGPNLNGLSGNRTVFPFQDITDAVAKLV